MPRMQDKICLVTGGASGIGLASAKRLAEEGAKVLITDIDVQAGEAAAASLAGDGLSVQFARHDVCSRDDWEAVIALAKGLGGAIDVIVNNAGIAGLGPIEFLSWADSVSYTHLTLPTNREV